ncbi:MAG: hypothetical protein H7X94_03860 [Vallitaleaceae bacterium]|nr:hypothetical protein [Vallitaleaceae bacterium]
MSSIIKSPFVSFAEQKKTIEVVSSNDAKIINKSVDLNDFEDEQDIVLDEISATDDHEFHETTYKNQPHTPQNLYENMFEQAQAEAEAILQSARENAIQIEKTAKTKGHKEGLKAGKEEAMQQIAGLKNELEESIAQFEKEKSHFYRSVEPKIAGIIMTLVTNMVGIQKFDKDTIFFVIKKGLEEMDVHGDLIIKVSSEDFDVVMQNKTYLEENMSAQIHIEVMKDTRLSKNDCIIETNLGIINCSLSERMNGLLRQLSLIEKSFGTH